jgi:hypothetical protein
MGPAAPCHQSRPSTTAHLVGGMSGGLLTTLLLHPVDLVKIRLQVYDGQVAGSNRLVFRTIIQQRGVRGLYQGLTPNAFGGAAAWGSYFFLYVKESAIFPVFGFIPLFTELHRKHIVFPFFFSLSPFCIFLGAHHLFS